jgi:murein L,D-transpeptidase YcbB/YkuD
MAGRLATETDVAAVLAQVEPQYEQYRALKRALARYRELPPLPALAPLSSRVVEPGDPYPDAGNLRNILGALEGARFAPPESASIYDEALSSAVRQFQEHHGLQADGRLGARTFAALTRPIEDRVRQVELTLERYRWLPDIRAPAVIVNVPQFMLYTLPTTTGGSVVRMPVVVGKSAQRTPIFDSAIHSVVFRPYWNVPTSITRNELLPLIAKDPGYLDRNEMEIVRGNGAIVTLLGTDAAAIAELKAGRARVRQRPGPQNALGLIKFELPNPYDVYLHSTPQLELFSRERRAFSHGCVRVSDASALAIYLLADTPGDWGPDAIEAATCEAAKTSTVRLSRPVPVFVLYVSVVVDRDGAVLFFDDVYGHDRELLAMLARRSARRHALGGENG